MEDQTKIKDYPVERTLIAFLVIGGLVALALMLFFVPIPSENTQVVPIVLTALTGMGAIIVGAVWKTSMTERRQAETITALAAAASAPLSTTVTTETTRGTDQQGQSGAGPSGTEDSGAVPDGVAPAERPLPAPADLDVFPTSPPVIGVGKEARES